MSDTLEPKAETVGDRVRIIRIALSMSQSQFAKRLNIQQPVVSYIESGARPISKRILDVLVSEGFSADWIMNGTQDKGPETIGNKINQVLIDKDHLGTPEGRMISSIVSALQGLDCMQLASVKGFVAGLKQQASVDKIVK